MEKEIRNPESIIERYEILMPFDADANVFLVRDRQTKELLVEKNITVHNPALYQELKEHPMKGIPRIHRIVHENHKILLIEEYIHGLDLMQLIQNEGPLSENRVVSYMLALCDILEPFHNMSPAVIHRDIKPGNIILDNYDEIFIIDFNISREYNPDSPLDTVSLVSHHFSAPEAYGFGQTDPRSDIYGIGATMHYLLTGGYLKETVYQGELAEIISKCTMMDPESRFQSINELKEALKGKSPEESKNDSNEWRRALPPGFREGKPLNMFVSSSIYAFLLWMCFTLNIESSLKGPLYSIDIWFQRTCIFIFFILTILIICDYMECLEKIPVIRRIPSVLLRIILSILILFSVTIGAMLVLAAILSGMR